MAARNDLKSKIRRPLLILIVVFPLVTLLLFNIALRIYVDRNARAELLGVSKIMETSIRNELANDLRDLTVPGINNAFTRLAKSLRASKLAVNTELLLFSRQQELLYPQDEDQTLSGQLVDKISARLPSLPENRVYTLRDGRTKYFLLAYPLTNLARGNPTVVFVSQTDKAAALIHTINLILIILLVLGAALAAVLAERLSVRIAKPVAKLSELTKGIGSGGNFSFPAQPDAATDIMEINMLHQSISEMTERLAAYDHSQKTFLQNASHELKTPLMSIQGYAEAIAGGVLPDTKHAAQIITSESIRLNTLVEELLTLSRIENQTYHQNLTVLSLNDVLKEYVQRLGGFATKLQKQLILSLPDTTVQVLADDALLSQAVMNIASNCLRYAGHETNITLLQREGSAIIRISDDGEGIPEADLPHVFERFYKGKGGNFGLGLAIAKSAVEFMGGRATASNSAYGAVFELVFPEAK